MNEVEEFIESGILEVYAMGSATKEEALQVELMLKKYPEVREELKEISNGLELFAMEHEAEVDVTIRPFLLAFIDYKSRLQNGEQPEDAPMLNEKSKASDFTNWLDRTDTAKPEVIYDYSARINRVIPQSNPA